MVHKTHSCKPSNQEPNMGEIDERESMRDMTFVREISEYEGKSR